MLKFLYIFLLGSLGLAQFSSIASRLYFFDFIIVIYVLYGLLELMLVKKSLKVSKYLLPFFLFSFIALISLIIPSVTSTISEFIFAFTYLVRFVFYLLAVVVTINAFKPKFIYKGFIYSAFVLALLGFVQLWLLPDFSVLSPELGWDPHKNRLASTFFDPNFLGTYFVLVLTIMLYKQVGTKAMFLVILSALFLTYSRSAWGMFGIVMLLYGLKKSGWIILLALLLGFSAYFAVPRIQTRISGITDPADSAHFRLISWKNISNIIQDNLFLGVGFNYLKNAKLDYGYLTPDTLEVHSAAGADSSFLLVLATTGIFGFLIFIFGYFQPLLKTPSCYTATLVITLFMGSQFINSIFYPQIMLLWMTMYGLLEKT